MKNNKKLYALLSVVILSSSLYLGCSSSSSSSGSSTGTFKGTITSFTTASVETKKKSMFAKINDFLFPKAHAAGVLFTVSCPACPSPSIPQLTELFQEFRLNVSPGDNTILFSKDGTVAEFSLDGAKAGETLEWDEIQIDNETITTENTGTWTGTITGIPMTLEISSGGNSASFTFSSSVSGGSGSGTEKGTSANGTYNVTSGSCSGELGSWTVTISGTSMSGTATITTVGSASNCGSVGDTATVSLTKS
jgi:hypothetical protein